MYQFRPALKEDVEGLALVPTLCERNSHGQNNLPAFSEDLQNERELGNAIHTGVDDPALSRAQRWADIRDVRARITGLKCDAVRKQDFAAQFRRHGWARTTL